MLSKEEIECIKQDLELIRDTKSSGTYTSYKIDQAIEYISQLETEIKDLNKKLTPEAMLNDLEKRYELYRDNTCLHCGKGQPKYCEKCYQELISQNAMLQQERDYYNQRYLEFNNAFIEGGKKLTKE